MLMTFLIKQADLPVVIIISLLNKKELVFSDWITVSQRGRERAWLALKYKETEGNKLRETEQKDKSYIPNYIELFS